MSTFQQQVNENSSTLWKTLGCNCKFKRSMVKEAISDATKALANATDIKYLKIEGEKVEFIEEDNDDCLSDNN
jgi:hypothetical protein